MEMVLSAQVLMDGSGSKSEFALSQSRIENAGSCPFLYRNKELLELDVHCLLKRIDTIAVYRILCRKLIDNGWNELFQHRTWLEEEDCTMVDLPITPVIINQEGTFLHSLVPS